MIQDTGNTFWTHYTNGGLIMIFGKSNTVMLRLKIKLKKKNSNIKMPSKIILGIKK